ncbi:M13 family metallopeptidase [bacterium]|nr:M13 family metallopeptidase [bacterium]
MSRSVEMDALKIQPTPQSLMKPCPRTSAAQPQPLESDRYSAPLSEFGWLQQANQLRQLPPPRSVGFKTENMDLSVDKNQDFYTHAMGGYLKTHPIPDSKELWGIDSEVNQMVQNDLTAILEQCARSPQDSRQKQLGDFYTAGLDQATRDACGLGPVQPLLGLIEGIATSAEIPAALGELQKHGVGALFSLFSAQDAKDQSQQVAQLFQDGLGLPNRDAYFKPDAQAQQLRVDYRQHISRMFQLTGVEPAEANQKALRVYAMEERLAAASLKPEELQDTEATYHPCSRADFEGSHPRTKLSQIFDRLGLQRLETFNLGCPDFFATVESMLGDTSKEEWQDYLKWQVLEQTAPTLSQPFVAESFAFRSKVTGVQAMPEPKETMVRATTELLGDPLSQLYVAQHFTPETRSKAESMVSDILAVLGERIRSASWMGSDTKAEALKKLESMRYKIGYPDRFKDTGKIEIRQDDHAGNVLRSKAAAFQEDLDRIGAPVDASRWLMQATEVNAYYDPSNNEFVFPAAILQPPYFDPAADLAINYGATGATIGHEITHGFDDEGRKFDSQGNMRDWWSAQDLEAFQERAEAVKDQFSKLKFEDKPVNGELVLGEALADLGGIELAYGAFEKAMQREQRDLHRPGRDGFTPAQLFFLSYAQSWATNLRPEAARNRMEIDPHPLPEFRVNAILANFPPFQQAFEIQPGSPMGRQGEEQNKLWS